MDDDKLFESIENQAVDAIMMKETWNGYHPKYLIKKWFPGFQQYIKNRRGDKNAPSYGPSQIKFEDDIKNPTLKKIYNDLGIYKQEQLNDYDTAEKATRARLKYLWDYELNSNQYDAYGQPIKSLEGLLYAWNRGTGKLNSGEARIHNSRYVRDSNMHLRNWGDHIIPQFGHYNFETIVTPNGVIFDIGE